MEADLQKGNADFCIATQLTWQYHQDILIRSISQFDIFAISRKPNVGLIITLYSIIYYYQNLPISFLEKWEHFPTFILHCDICIMQLILQNIISKHKWSIFKDGTCLSNKKVQTTRLLFYPVLHLWTTIFIDYWCQMFFGFFVPHNTLLLYCLWENNWVCGLFCTLLAK